MAVFKPTQQHTFTVLDIATMGLMVAMLEAVKRALDGLPNVELVTFLIIMFTLFYGWKTVFVTFAFTTLEAAFWGVNVWIIMYFYMWPLLVLIVYLTRNHASVWFYSIVSGFYGLCFGGLCSIPYLFIGGPTMMFTWWVSGIPFDIIHAISNFILCLLLYTPVHRAFGYAQRYIISETHK